MKNKLNNQKEESRKEYQKPELKECGSIKEDTHAGPGAGVTDAGTWSN